MGELNNSCMTAPEREEEDLNSCTYSSEPVCCKYITIGPSVTAIADEAFKGCSSELTSLMFAYLSSLTTIGSMACYNTTQLTGSITIPRTVTTIKAQAFYKCGSLKTVTISANSLLTTIESGAFQFCSSLTAINLAPTTLLQTIGSSAFEGCLGAVSLKFAANTPLTTISESCFAFCSKLGQVELSPQITSIGEKAFSTCESLEIWTVREGSQLSDIGKQDFASCNSLQQFTLCTNINQLAFGEGVFMSCHALEWFECHLSSSIAPTAFDDCPILNTVKFFIGKASSLQSDDLVSWFSDKTIFASMSYFYVPCDMYADSRQLREQKISVIRYSDDGIPCPEYEHTLHIYLVFC